MYNELYGLFYIVFIFVFFTGKIGKQELFTSNS